MITVTDKTAAITQAYADSIAGLLDMGFKASDLPRLIDKWKSSIQSVIDNAGLRLDVGGEASYPEARSVDLAWVNTIQPKLEESLRQIEEKASIGMITVTDKTAAITQAYADSIAEALEMGFKASDLPRLIDRWKESRPYFSLQEGGEASYPEAGSTYRFTGPMPSANYPGQWVDRFMQGMGGVNPLAFQMTPEGAFGSGNMTAWLAPDLMKASGGIGEALGNLTKGIGDAIGPALQEIGDFFKPVADQLANIFGPLGNVVAGITGAFTGAIGSLSSVSAILDPIRTIFNSMMQVLGPSIDRVLLPVVGALAKIGVTLGTILIPILDWLSPIIDDLANGFIWLYNEAIMPAGNWLAKTFESIGTVMDYVGSNFKAAIENIASWFSTLGTNIGILIQNIGIATENLGASISMFVHNLTTYLFDFDKWETAVQKDLKGFVLQPPDVKGMTGDELAEALARIAASNGPLTAINFADLYKAGADYLTSQGSTGYPAAQYTTGRNYTMIFNNFVPAVGDEGLRKMAVLVQAQLDELTAHGYN
jgi:hypothetical protein